MDPHCDKMNILVTYLRTFRQCIGIEKASDVLNVIQEQVFGFLTYPNQTERTSILNSAI